MDKVYDLSKDIVVSKMLKNPEYLSSCDLIDSIDDNGGIKYKNLVVTFKSITCEDVTDMEKVRSGKKDKKSKKSVVRFTDPTIKPYILKAAIVIANIEKAVGTIVVNNWIGKSVTLYVEKGVEAFGKITDAIRVKPFPVTTDIICSSCGNKIVAFNKPDGTTMTAVALATYTKQQYNMQLCSDCAMAMVKMKADKEVK